MTILTHGDFSPGQKVITPWENRLNLDCAGEVLEVGVVSQGIKVLVWNANGPGANVEVWFWPHEIRKDQP